MKSDKHIFISYSRQDKKIVEKLSRDLQKHGISIWRDVEQINPGENWLTGIQNAIENAGAYLYILSKNSTNSEWVLFEHAVATLKDILIIPIIVDDIDKINIPSQLGKTHWIDLTDNYDIKIKDLFRVLSDFRKKENIKKVIHQKSKGFVFISYSTKNLVFVDTLTQWLKTQKYGFFDYHSSKRNYQTLFFLELEDQIKNSAAVLSVLSPEWKISKWAVREFLFAEEISKPIFLLHHKTMPPCLLTVGIPYIDFTNDEISGFKELNREMSDKGL